MLKKEKKKAGHKWENSKSDSRRLHLKLTLRGIETSVSKAFKNIYIIFFQENLVLGSYLRVQTCYIETR
jgi:hypothetical protein